MVSQKASSASLGTSKTGGALPSAKTCLIASGVVAGPSLCESFGSPRAEARVDSPSAREGFFLQYLFRWPLISLVRIEHSVHRTILCLLYFFSSTFFLDSCPRRCLHRL